MSKNKLVSLKSALVWRSNLRKQGKKAVFTNGCFDIIHSGHIAILEKARAMGGALVVGLNSDASVKRLKGAGRPINNQKDRAIVLSALSAVDKVVIFNEDTPFGIIKSLRPDILVKGADYKTNEVIGREYADKVALIKLVKGKSTTSTIRKTAKLNTSGRIY